jgi:hypothetical protein
MLELSLGFSDEKAGFSESDLAELGIIPVIDFMRPPRFPTGERSSTATDTTSASKSTSAGRLIMLMAMFMEVRAS